MFLYHHKRWSSAWITWAKSQEKVDLKWKVGDVARRVTGPPETIRTLLISHTLVQHNKFNKKKKKGGLDRCCGTVTTSPSKTWPEVDKDALLDQTSVRLLWTFFSTKPWPWASVFTFLLPHFVNNPTYLDWFRLKPPTPVTWSTLIYDQIPHSSPQPPGDVWSPTCLWQGFCQIDLARNSSLPLMFSLSNFPSTDAHPAPWLQISTCSCWIQNWAQIYTEISFSLLQ